MEESRGIPGGLFKIKNWVELLFRFSTSCCLCCVLTPGLESMTNILVLPEEEDEINLEGKALNDPLNFVEVTPPSTWES